MNRRVAVAVVVILAVGVAVAAYTRNSVVRVNGEYIKPAEFYKALQIESGKQVLDRLISERLIRQEAKKLGITVSREDIDKEIGRIKSQFSSEEDFQSALKDAGMTMTDLSDGISTNLLLKKISLKDVKITEEDVQKYFEEHKDTLGEPTKVRVRHVLLKTRQDAEDVLKELKAGGDMAKIASEKSLDTATKKNGGDLGFIVPGDTAPEFEKVAFSLKVGELSGVVETSFGFHILRVEERQEAKPATLDAVRHKVMEALESERAKPVDQVIEELRSRAEIKVFWDMYKSFEKPAAQ